MRAIESLFWSERWQLAALDRSDLQKIGLVSLMVGFVFVMFHLQGNTSDINAFGRSVLLWMYTRWSDSSVSFGATDYSHGFLIPLASLGVLWYRRNEFFQATKSVSKLGLFIFVGSLLLHWLGAKSQHPRVSLLALLGILWGIPFYLFGWQVAKWLLFPCAFLIFCVPLNFLDELTFPLRMLMAKSSTLLVNGLGIAAERVGSEIYLSSGGEIQKLDVAAPCSGLRSLMAMTALTALYAYLTQDGLIRKWMLFLCSIPLAIIGNIARITTLAVVAEAFGQEVAVGPFHDWSGYIVFAVAIAFMVAVGNLLDVDYLELWKKWKVTLYDHTSLSSA